MSILTSNQLRAMRSHWRITQAELAALAKISPTAIAEFECGKRSLRSDTIDRIFAALGVTVTHRIGETEFV
jgi:transcriptional regulator with XRE-family HTH domain